MKRISYLLLFFAFVLLISLNFISAWDDNGSLIQSITGCNILNTTSAIYVLTSDVNSTGSCFTITQPNITLDCNNFWINYSTGGTAYSIGITTNQSNTTVKNCNVTDGNWTSSQITRYGIYFNELNYGIILNNSINTNNSVAIYLDNSSFNNLTLNTGISNTTFAIYLGNSSFNNLTLNTGISNPLKILSTNLLRGISLHYSSNNNLVSNTGMGWGCDYTGCNPDGIFLSFSSNNTLINNTGRSSEDAIILYSSSNNTLINNTGISDASVGLWIYGSSNNTLIGNTGISNRTSSSGDNTAYGIYIGGESANSDNNTLISNVGISYSGCGIMLDTSSNNKLINITALSFNATSISKSAIYIWQSNYTNISDCANISGIAGDIYFNSGAGSIENVFTNCSYNSSKEFVNGAGNYLIRKWYYQAYVNDVNANSLSDVSVIATNSSGNVQFTALTNSTGWIERQNVIEYINTAGTANYYSNYIISASKTGYIEDSITYNLTLVHNLNPFITLSEIVPVEVPAHSSGGSTTYINQSKYLSRYYKFLKEGQEFKINLSNFKDYTLKMESVLINEGKVIISFNNENYSIFLNEYKKISLDNNDYYDVNISLINITLNGYAKLLIELIHEGIINEEQEQTIENVSNNNSNNDLPITDNTISNNKKGIKWYYLLILGLLILLILFVLIRFISKESKRRDEFLSEYIDFPKQSTFFESDYNGINKGI